MEFFNLVLQAFSAALSWWTQIVTADAWLFSAFLGLIFVSLVNALFISPFFQGVIHGGSYGAGSDWARSKRKVSAKKSNQAKK